MVQKFVSKLAWGPRQEAHQRTATPTCGQGTEYGTSFVHFQKWISKCSNFKFQWRAFPKIFQISKQNRFNSFSVFKHFGEPDYYWLPPGSIQAAMAGLRLQVRVLNNLGPCTAKVRSLSVSMELGTLLFMAGTMHLRLERSWY